jgi:hypothetical protein
MTEIKVIPTRYKGYRFRSRSEARFAVFLDTLGVKWEYEKEGYDLGKHGYYLPDFWLPDVSLRSKKDGIFVEIKGNVPTEKEQSKCLALAKMTGCDVVLFVGLPSTQHGVSDYESTDNLSGYQFGSDGSWDINMSLFQCTNCGHIKVEYWEGNYEICPRCNNGCNDKSCLKDDYKIVGGCYETTDKLMKAYSAARSARFEHGESG